jgi:succinyl-CoA synthetase alpha subunit
LRAKQLLGRNGTRRRDISGGKGTAAEKISALKAAGIHVAESPADIGITVKKALDKSGKKKVKKSKKKAQSKKKVSKKPKAKGKRSSSKKKKR